MAAAARAATLLARGSAPGLRYVNALRQLLEPRIAVQIVQPGIDGHNHDPAGVLVRGTLQRRQRLRLVSERVVNQRELPR